MAKQLGESFRRKTNRIGLETESPALFQRGASVCSLRERKTLTGRTGQWMSKFLETLKERIVVFDGAMGTNLQVQNLTLDDFGGLRFEGCNENLLITRPDAVENVHTAFLDVGCDVIETNSFNGTTVDFAEYAMADQTYDMNVRAASLAKRIASDYSTKEKPRWVAGQMGPGRKMPTLGHISFLDLKAAYAEQ